MPPLNQRRTSTIGPSRSQRAGSREMLFRAHWGLGSARHVVQGFVDRRLWEGCVEGGILSVTSLGRLHQESEALLVVIRQLVAVVLEEGRA